MKASVIVPAYNAENTIGKCLESLQKQSFNNFEVIVVDDASSDSTVEVAKSFPGIKIVKQKHGGPAVGRNNGAKAAKGEILVFTDSDCILDRAWLEQMVKPFEDQSVGGVQGRYKSRQRSLVARFGQLEIEERHEKMARQKSIDFMGSYSAAYRKDLFSKMDGFDTSFPIASGEDTDFSFRVNEAGHKMLFNENAIVFHKHPESLLKYLKIKFFRAFWRTKVYKRHQAKIVQDSYTGQTVKVQVLLFYALIISAAVAVFYPELYLLPWAVLALLLLSTLPFAGWAFSKDRAVGILSPGIILLRTSAFGFGIPVGILREIVGR